MAVPAANNWFREGRQGYSHHFAFLQHLFVAISAIQIDIIIKMQIQIQILIQIMMQIQIQIQMQMPIQIQRHSRKINWFILFAICYQFWRCDPYIFQCDRNSLWIIFRTYLPWKWPSISNRGYDVKVNAFRIESNCRVGKDDKWQMINDKWSMKMMN